ncbi:MAG TPA: YbaK/EbsC family protein [Candidatus Nanoarchaeia archaeon]|nr:YbaK/EbsC family protein [Candidatus Nanoarchaeia archaeon]
MKQDFEKIKKFLDSNKIKYEVLEHESVFTSEDAARVRNAKLEEGAKSMVVRSSGKFYNFVLSASKKLDWNKIKEILNTKSASLASPEEVLSNIHCEIGSVPPFGNLYGLEVYCDPSLLNNLEIEFNAGLHTNSIRMKAEDWKRIVKPIVIDFTK